MFEYARMAIEELDFDGFRFDFVKGFGAWMIGLLAKYQYQKKDGAEFSPFVVGEYWSGPDDIDAGWIDGALAVTDKQIAAFDFPLRYKLKDVCDTPNYDLRNLTDGGSVSAARPFQRGHLCRQSRHGRQRSRQRQDARLLLHPHRRRLSLRLLVGLLQLRARASAGPRTASTRSLTRITARGRGIHSPARRSRPLHHAARRTPKGRAVLSMC